MLDWTGARVMKLFLLVEVLEFQRFNSFDGEDPNKGVNPDEAVSYGTSVGCGTTYSWSPKRISLDRKALEWLDGNQNAEKEDCEEKLKEVEAVCNLIFTSVYQTSGGAPGGAAGGER